MVFPSGKSISDDPSNNQDYENRFETELNERPKLDSPNPISKNTTNEEDNDEIDPKYICYYSDLPSVLNYQEEEDE